MCQVDLPGGGMKAREAATQAGIPSAVNVTNPQATTVVASNQGVTYEQVNICSLKSVKSSKKSSSKKSKKTKKKRHKDKESSASSFSDSEYSLSLNEDSDDKYGYMMINTDEIKTINSFVDSVSMSNQTESFEEIQIPENTDSQVNVNEWGHQDVEEKGLTSLVLSFDEDNIEDDTSLNLQSFLYRMGQ